MKKSRQQPEVKCENVLMRCVLGFYKWERVPGPEWSAASLNKSSKSNRIGAVIWIDEGHNPTWTLSTVRARDGLIRYPPLVETICITCFMTAFQMSLICHGFQTNHATHFFVVGWGHNVTWSLSTVGTSDGVKRLPLFVETMCMT